MEKVIRVTFRYESSSLPKLKSSPSVLRGEVLATSTCTGANSLYEVIPCFVVKLDDGRVVYVPVTACTISN